MPAGLVPPAAESRFSALTVGYAWVSTHCTLPSSSTVGVPFLLLAHGDSTYAGSLMSCAKSMQYASTGSDEPATFRPSRDAGVSLPLGLFFVFFELMTLTAEAVSSMKTCVPVTVSA